MKQFWIGCGLGVALSMTGAIWFIAELEGQPVRFPSKRVFGDPQYYHFEGSIYGQGEDAPVNNYIDTWCWRERMECEVTTQNEVNGGVGSLHEDTIKVRKWDDREIVADSDGKNPRQCNWYEIRIDTKTEEIAYTRIPNKNPTAEICKEFIPRVMRWRIDNGNAWETNADGSKR